MCSPVIHCFPPRIFTTLRLLHAEAHPYSPPQLEPRDSLADKIPPRQASSNANAKDAAIKKKDEIAPEQTPLEKMLQHAGPLRTDGSDRFYGFENVSAGP